MWLQLRHLDRVFWSRIDALKMRSFYIDFPIIRAPNELNPTQSLGSNDCGVYVINHMKHKGHAWPRGVSAILLACKDSLLAFFVFIDHLCVDVGRKS